MQILSELSHQFAYVAKAISLTWLPLLAIVLGLWLIQVVNKLTDDVLNRFGIIPRHILGLPGIVFSPLLHADFGHLFLNTIPLYILMNLVAIHGWVLFAEVTAVIVLGGGFLVWLFGRMAIHIGASGLVMGYWGYLLVNAIYHFSILTIILAVLCLYYFASLYVNLFPAGKRSSWEGHVFGFVAGVAAVYLTPF